MTRSSRQSLGFLALLSIAILPSTLHAQEHRRVMVMTNYPETLTKRFSTAFTKLHPDVDVEFIAKQSREAAAELSKPDHGGIDVYWSPAVQTFARFKSAFEPLHVDRAALPGKLGDAPLSDPQGAYEAFEVAGYGLAYNPAGLKELGEDVPTTWQAAGNPKFAGKVVLPNPAQIGFAPALYEVILQSQGWYKGWELLSEAAGNADWDADVHSLEGIADKKDALAFTIDFIPLTAAAKGKPVAITYPQRTTFLPARVALLDHAPHAEDAKSFIDFVLSKDGQSLLLESGGPLRYPVRPEVYAAAPNVTNPFALPQNGLLNYDDAIATRRRATDIALFDVVLYQQRARLKETWARLHQVEELGGDSVQLGKVRKILSFVPVSVGQSLDKDFLAQIPQGKELPAALREEWQKAIEAHLDEADAALASLSKAP